MLQQHQNTFCPISCVSCMFSLVFMVFPCVTNMDFSPSCTLSLPSGCSGTWDKITCWPSANTGEVVTIPCPKYLFYFSRDVLTRTFVFFYKIRSICVWQSQGKQLTTRCYVLRFWNLLAERLGPMSQSRVTGVETLNLVHINLSIRFITMVIPKKIRNSGLTLKTILMSKRKMWDKKMDRLITKETNERTGKCSRTT